MKIDGCLARNIDFEVANSKVPKKTRRKTSILKLQSVKIGGSLARNARFYAPTRIVSSLSFSCGLPVSMGEAAKHVLFEGFQTGCNVVLRGRRCTLRHSNLFDNVSKVVFRGRRNTFASFSQDELQLSWRVQHVGDLCRNFRGRRSTPHSTLHTLHSTLYTSHSTLHTLHSAFHTPPFTLHTPHYAHYIPRSTLHTLPFTLHTPHFTLHTPHSTLRIPHSTLYTPHSTLHTLQSTLHTLHFTLYTPHFTRHTDFTFRTLHSALRTLHFTL